MRVVKHIQNPCLFINAEDDPLCVLENVYEGLTLFKEIAGVSGAIIVTTKTGSHCSFLHGMPWTMDAWTERTAGEFFDQVLNT